MSLIKLNVSKDLMSLLLSLKCPVSINNVYINNNYVCLGIRWIKNFQTYTKAMSFDFPFF